MGFQQSIVKAKQGQEEALISFAINNGKWFSDRDISPYGAVRVTKDLWIGGTTFKKGEICLVVGGERHYQRMYGEGLYEHDLVQHIYLIDDISHDLNSEKDTGDLLDEYFPVIKDE